MDLSANFSRIIAILAVCMIVITVLFTTQDNTSRMALAGPLIALLGVAFAFLFAKNGQEKIVREIRYEVQDDVNRKVAAAREDIKEEAVKVAAELVEKSERDNA